jgi:hypothetical protein
MAPYLVNAHWAITQCELWDWLRTYSPPAGEGFSTTPSMKRINAKMNEQDIAGGHSGASYGRTMRAMESIAKNGYEKYKEVYKSVRGEKYN